MIALIKAQLKAGLFSSLGRSHKMMVVAMIAIGVVTSLILSETYYAHLKTKNHQAVARQAQLYADELESQVHTNLRIVDVIWALFEGSENVSRAEFNHVASELFKPAPYLEFVMWLPDHLIHTPDAETPTMTDALNYPDRSARVWPVIGFLKRHVKDSQDTVSPRFSDQRLGLPFIKQAVWLDSPLKSMTFNSDVAVVALPMPRSNGGEDTMSGWLVVGLAIDSLVALGADKAAFESLFFSDDAGLVVSQNVAGIERQIYSSVSRERMGEPYINEVISLGPRIHWQVSFYPSLRWLAEREGLQRYSLAFFGFVLTALVSVILMLRFGVLERRTKDLREQVNSLEAQLQQLSKESARDLDTGLLLRSDLESRLDMECRRAVREFLPLSFLIATVDQSHAWQDLENANEYIKRVALSLAELVSRPGDVGVRFDEFSVAFLLPATNEQVTILAERCREKVEALAIEHPVTYQPLTVSIGVITLQPTDGLCSEKVITSAATALIQAQAQGGNCVVANVEEADELPVTFLV